MQHSLNAQTDQKAKGDGAFQPPPAFSSPPTPNGRWLWIGDIVLIGILIVAFRDVIRDHFRPLEPPPDLPTVKVQVGTVEKTLRITGSTLGENTVTLITPHLRGSRTRGGGGDFRLVLKDLVTSGKHVKKGDIVATFDSQPMRDRLVNLRDERIQDQATFRSLAANLKAKREAFDQQVRAAKATVDQAALDLQTAPVRSAIDAELLRLSWEQAKAQYAALVGQTSALVTSQQAQLNEADLETRMSASELQRAEMNMEHMTVRAPREGIAIIREITRNGEFGTIRAGDELHAGQPYVDIVAPGPMLVDAKVNQVDISHLRIGQSAHVVPDAFPDLKVMAHVTSIGTVAASSGFRANYVREIPVELRIDGRHPDLLPSLTVSAAVVLDRAEPAVMVSRAAIFKDKRTGNRYALLQTNNGWRKQTLQLGLRNALMAEVLSGLEAGDTVAEALPAE